MATAPKPKGGFLAGALKAVRGDAQSPQDIQVQISEINAGIVGAQAVLAKLEGERGANLQNWLAKGDDKAAAANGQAIIAAKDTITALEQKRERALAVLHSATVEREAAELHERWDAARKIMRTRSAEVEKMQGLAEELTAAHKRVEKLSVDLWSALPEPPSGRPLTFGKSISDRLNLFLFGISEGLLGTGHVSAFVARKQPDLVETDAEVQKILLLPLQKSMS